MDEIWARLAPESREWLIANNGDAIPVEVAAEIDELIEAVGADDVWAITPGIVPDEPIDADDADEIVDEDGESGARYLAEDAIDWIEEYANDE